VTISRVVNGTSRSIIDDSRVMLQIVPSLMIIIYNCKMFKEQAKTVNTLFVFEIDIRRIGSWQKVVASNTLSCLSLLGTFALVTQLLVRLGAYPYSEP
jgi:hypothetical protein